MSPYAIDALDEVLDDAKQQIETLTLALESIIRWTDFDIHCPDRLDAIHAVANAALVEVGAR